MGKRFLIDPAVQNYNFLRIASPGISLYPENQVNGPQFLAQSPVKMQ